MQHEVTTFDFIFYVLDKFYAVIMLIMLVTVSCYTANHIGLALLIVLGIIGMIIKTFVGFFNYSLIVDVLQCYLDLGMTLCVGRIFGLLYQIYITDFYNFSPMSLVIPLAVAIALFSVRSGMKNKRIYYNKI